MTEKRVCRDLLLEIFDHVYVLSLPNRHDRRREINRQLMRLGLSFDDPAVTLFDAIRPEEPSGFPSVGARGCFLSHLKILRAIAKNHNYALILEDDANFSNEIVTYLEILAQPLRKAHWDILYAGNDHDLSGHIDSDAILIELNPSHEVTLSHAVAFSRRAAECAAQTLQAMLSREPGDPLGGPMHVDGAYNWVRKGNPELKTMATVIALAYQRSSRTDIHELPWFDRFPLVRNIVGLVRNLR